MHSLSLVAVCTFVLAALSAAQPVSDATASRGTAPAVAAAVGKGAATAGSTAVAASEEHSQRIQKRTVSGKEPPTPEELSVLKDLILNRIASELSENLRDRTAAKRNRASNDQERKKEEEEEEEEEVEAEEAAEMLAKAKRMFVPLSGLPGELPTIKRQIRYHQCYFNPISCFRRK